MSADRTTLADFQESGFDYTPLSLARSAASPAVIESELDAWQMDPDWLGEQPENVPGDVTFHRYQFDRLYFYPIAVGFGDEKESELGAFEFRTYVNWVGSPPQALKDHIREHDNPRLVTLFDTGPYDGWITGFNFVKHASNVEDTEVAENEVNNLGIPQFEVLCMDEDGKRTGHAGGFFDPFGLLEEIPQHEAWNLTRNDARQSYEIRPQAGARQRLLGKQKEVYINGQYVGNTVPTRGTVWLKMEYGTLDGTFKDRTTGQQMWSRQKLISDGGVSPNAIRAGGKVWKMNESEDVILLRATRPADFDPTPPEEVDPERATQMVLSESTTFDVRHDSGPKLGKYAPPVTRDIEFETDTDHFGTVPFR